MSSVLERIADAVRPAPVADGVSKFQVALDNAVVLYREMTAGSPKFEPHHASLYRNQKLTKEAFLALACKNAHTSVYKLGGLRKELNEPDAHFPMVAAFIGEVTRRITSTRIDEGALSAPPRVNLMSLLPHWRDSQWNAFTLEYLRLTATDLQVFALAVLMATETAPESCWGTSTDLVADAAKAEDRDRQFKQLLADISAAWTISADADFLLLDPTTGTGKMVWKLAPDISVFPAGAEQLVAYLAAKQDASTSELQ